MLVKKKNHLLKETAVKALKINLRGEANNKPSVQQKPMN